MGKRLWFAFPFFWSFYAFSVVIVFGFSYFMFRSTSSRPSCSCPSCASRDFLFPSIGSLTFFSVPRPVSTEALYNRTKLAISSWLSASPTARVTLFVNRTEFDPSDKLPTELETLFGHGRVTYAGGLKHDLTGVPYIDDWFRQGIRQSQSKYVCFINSDILISADWLSRVSTVDTALQDRSVLMIGQRIDFDIKEELFDGLTFTQSTFLKQVDAMVQNSPHTDHSPYGVDTFTFRLDRMPFDPERIPPFLMGRYNWDNWIIGYLNVISETVTFNLNPPIYHMNHVRHNFDIEDDKVAVNHHTKKANKDYFGSNYDTTWEVVQNELVHRRNGTKLHL
jgi:hypothetical protein